MKTPTSKQLQDWTKEWQRIKQLQHLESDSGNPNTISDEETEQIERKDSAVALLRMKHTGQLAVELGRALNEMDVVPPWQEEKKAMNRYQTDQSVLIPLTLRFLDHLRHLEDTGYAALREVGHQYGCVSPISRILAAQRDLTIDKNQKDKYAKKLKEYVNTLTERLLREREAFIERYEFNEPDYVKAEAEQDLRNLVEQCVITTSNSETRLADIDQEFSLSITGMIDQIMQDGFYIPNYFMSVDGERMIEDRKKIEDLITHSNLEKKAELGIDYYYELAFYNPQSNLEDVELAAFNGVIQNIIREWLISSGAISREMVIESSANPPLQFASVSVMRSLFSSLIEDEDEDVLIANAKWACANSSYGGLRCFLEAIKKGNIALNYNDWVEMLRGAINGHDPDVLSSAVKMILPMNELMKVDHNWLILNAVKADMDSEETRYGYSRLDALLDAGIKIYSIHESQQHDWQVKRHNEFEWAYPLGLACAMGCKRPVIEKLIAIGDVNDRDKNGRTALMEACREGHGDIVSQLIQAGANVNDISSAGETILMTAAIRAAISGDDIVKQLINANADPDQTSHCHFVSHSDRPYSNSTILQFAAIMGAQEGVGILLDAGASVDARNNRGLTALMYACVEGNESIVTQLLDAGASVDARNNGGLTALMGACEEGNESIVTQLLEAGSDALASDNDGNHVADYAKKTGNREIINAVEKAIKSSYTLSLSRENRLGNIPTSGINSSHATMEPGRVLEELSTAAQKMNPSQDAPRPR